MNLLKKVGFYIYLATRITFWFWFSMTLLLKPMAWIFFKSIQLINDALFLINGKRLEIIIVGDDDDEEI
jgi:hypothetical protein